MATVAPATLKAQKSDGPQKAWLHGPASDLLLGSGVLYMLFFIGLAFYGPEIRHAQAPYLLALLVCKEASCCCPVCCHSAVILLGQKQGHG